MNALLANTPIPEQLDQVISDLRVRKRDGETLQPFDRRRVESAIAKAMDAVGVRPPEHLSQLIDWICAVAADQASLHDGVIDVEAVQDIVEYRLMTSGLYEVARHYIQYRQQHAEDRATRLKPDPTMLQKLIEISKYARYLPEKRRREVPDEMWDRVETFFANTYPEQRHRITPAIMKARERKLTSSSRLKQFAGPATTYNNARAYNCWTLYCNRPRAFAETFWLLLSGGGVGYSVQWHHVDQLPPVRLPDHQRVKHHVVADTIEGWADALHDLVMSYVEGYYVEFSYHRIRAAGSPLKLSGGKAPGHIPLKKALERVRGILDTAASSIPGGRRLRPIECHDIMCHAADAVLSGGIRRSAMISLFSVDDSEMMLAKTGNWWQTHPWRARANNSAMAIEDQISRDQYDRLFRWTQQYGEPGIVFAKHPDYIFNPCVEAMQVPKFEVTAEKKQWLEQWAAKNDIEIPAVEVGEVYYGCQACNLTEINVAACESPEEFLELCRHASVLGTLQAGLTDFPYMDWVTRAIVEYEALLGVGLTGILDNPDIGLNPELLRQGAEVVKITNQALAAEIGIEPAARTTLVKPSGTASLAFGSVGSGIHPHHARRYFRRVTFNRLEPPYQHFKQANAHMCYHLNDTDDIVVIPVQAPDAAVTRKDLTALEFLDHVELVQENWVRPGTARPDTWPGACHNVSNTVTVRDDEWDAVREHLWQKRNVFAAVSMLPEIGDKKYANAPREEVSSPDDEKYWQRLIANYQPVDWESMVEEEDNTDHTAEAACAGGACEI